MKVIIHGAYFKDGKAAMEGINEKETEWCCDQFKNAGVNIQFNYKKNRFESGSMIDLGMGGFGNRLIDRKPLKKCPYCGESLKKITVERRGHKSINDASEAIKK